MKQLSVFFLVALAFVSGCSSRQETLMTQPMPTPEAGEEGTQIAHLTPEQARTLVDQEQDLVVLDVRTAEEYRSGHIPGALNFDFNGPEFAEKIDQLDKDKAYLVHCASGGRSTRSLDVFKEKGFKMIYHLDGGFRAWKSQGSPVAPSPVPGSGSVN